ncbi:MAG: outer membrane protein assembly factor BamA [Bryobacteraceae bacterium]
MPNSRHHCLRTLALSLIGSVVMLGQQAPAPPKPPANPFEAVTEAPTQAPTAAQASDVIDSIEFRGSRRVPQDTLRAIIFTKKGDLYNDQALHRDLITLWNQGRFDDIRMERERAETGGWIVRFVVVERPVVRTLEFAGAKTVTTSDILERFRDRRVGLSVESQFDPNRLQRAVIVLQELLAERGRQFAKVTPDIQQLPPASLAITLRVDEGPKVKVGKINFEGNSVYNDRLIKRSMKVLKPTGIPYSVFAENLFAKTYDSVKAEVDEQLISQFYQKNGYFMARVTDTKVELVDGGNGQFRLPLIHPNKQGKKADITMTIEEGRRYKLNNINFVGVKLFSAPEALMRPVFQMAQGDYFSTEKLQKGLDELRKLYGNYGYINFLADPLPEIVPNSDLVNLTLNFDEGSQFFVRRIDFSGNTTTRDKVIRRELMIDEGNFYSENLWELSLLRLNQLGYFQTLKKDESVDMKTDTRTNTVDLTLKVREQGKNTIQMSGGVSGIQGSFLGFQYSTNNFLGMGETLSLSSSAGTRYKEVQLSFTEPYFLDRPIQFGASVTISRFTYNQGREASVLAGANLIPLYNSLGAQNLLNYNTNTKGFSVFSSYQLKRSFARIGISYGYNIQNVQTLTESAKQYYNYLNFQQINGPNQLDGIKTSYIQPTYSYNSTDNPMIPTRGTRASASLQFAGGFLGGGVNQIQPQVDIAHFRKGFKPKHVIGMHVLASYVTGYGGKTAPPFNRFFMGGENDIRGFQLYTVSPIAFIPISAPVNQLNNDGTPRQQKGIINTETGQTGLVNVTQNIPAYQLVFPGGDTKVVANFEYRVPIFGPVTLAAFFDAGVNRLSNASQLTLNPSRINELNAEFPEAAFQNRAVVAYNTQVIRSSTGLELQVLMPVFNQPFRIYWAYNPSRVRDYIQPPIVADRSYFPNYPTFINSIATFGQPVPLFERKSIFRFTIGRTF